MLKFKSELSNRNKSETGIHYEWYALQRWGANYWEDFFRPKIIYPGIMRIAKSNSSNFPRFCFDQIDNFFFGNDCYFIVGNNLDYLWLVLNTSLVGYLFRYYIYSFDETGFKMFTDYFQNIPIPLPNQLTLKQTETFINGSINANDVNAWIYEMIGFTEDEILEIENSLEIIINGSTA